MKLKINTPVGPYYYKFVPIYNGLKPIDKVIARENLLLFKKIMDEQKLSFLLAYGSLLGAVREKDFISHDEDIDLMMAKEDMPKFLSILFVLRDAGFEVVRYERRGFLSIMRKGEYIDFYFFHEYEADNRLIKCCMDVCPKSFLTEKTTIPFQGAEFEVSKDFEKYLEFNYGKNWMQPVTKFNFGLSAIARLKSKMTQYVKALRPYRLTEKLHARKEPGYTKKCLDKVYNFL